MSRNQITLLAFWVPFTLSAQTESISTKQLLEEINQNFPQLLYDFSIPGAAIAIIENGGVLKCEDKFYKFTLVPIGDDKFVNPALGALWRFDTKDQDAKPRMLFGGYKFNKVK